MDNPEEPKDISETEGQTTVAAQNDDGIPQQYKGLPSELVQELWQPAIAVDQQRAGEQTEQRTQAIAKLKEREVAEEKSKIK